MEKNGLRKNITKSERYNILKKQNWRCAICGERLKFSKKHEYGNEVGHIDHIHPISKSKFYKGYIHERKNLQGLCQRCNLLKKDKPQYYCPRCKKPLEIGTFNVDKRWKDYDPDDIELIWICNDCGNFYPEYEVLKEKTQTI